MTRSVVLGVYSVLHTGASQNKVYSWIFEYQAGFFVCSDYIFLILIKILPLFFVSSCMYNTRLKAIFCIVASRCHNRTGERMSEWNLRIALWFLVRPGEFILIANRDSQHSAGSEDDHELLRVDKQFSARAICHSCCGFNGRFGTEWKWEKCCAIMLSMV